MPVLFDLSTDIALSILMDWLGDTKSLVALDSASARSIRWAYLGLVRDPRFLLADIIFCPGQLNDIRFWISNRGVKIQALHVSSSPALKEVVRVSYECLSAVVSLKVTCRNGQQADVECLRILLKLLPSLTSLDLAYFSAPNDDYLVVMSTMHHLRLRTLTLDDVSQSAGNLAMVIQRFCSTLEVLELGAKRCVDAAILHLMGSTCNLKELCVTCVDIAFEDLAVVFGARRFPLLEELRLRYYCRRTTPDHTRFQDDFILALHSNHPSLETVSIVGSLNIKISLLSVTVALAHCPNFRDMYTGRFQFHTVFTAERSYDSDVLPYCTLHIMEPHQTLTTDLRATLQSIACASSLRKVRAFSSSNILTNDEVEAIVSAFGTDLIVLDVFLGAEVSHQTLERLILECTALRKLCFNTCAPFTDNLVMLLADQGHHIRNLSLAGAVNVTNASICYLLQRLGHRLQELCVDQCLLLTGSTLIAIVEYCTLLESLDIAGTGITADAVIAYVIKPNRLLNLDALNVDPELLAVIHDFMAKKENGASKRWSDIV